MGNVVQGTPEVLSYEVQLTIPKICFSRAWVRAEVL
jgi:hypothetical protein